MSADHSGPAFPCFEPGYEGSLDRAGMADTHHSGMSLRDWFAGQALIAQSDWLEGPPGSKTPYSYEGRAVWAYAQADAMLAERFRKSEKQESETK